ncbi:DUF1127 domain-containing protein [Rhizobium sp. CNPSo 4062]|uniref:DUF1127 domain-containing protein n=1 Tax=Rhizobium sp. CNPSo 4062 TaxID=3021410 RepID=UPI00254D5FFA|nr:DUF1127 domain-containing protein [Rhizobium sp. CNPSo 4062]MDK4703583.1 DUF1127 domain-containing protein [Rhizobium sp. CNPSo 4062]
MSQFASFGSMHQNCHHYVEMKMSTMVTICSTEAGDPRAAGVGIRAAQPRPHWIRRLWALYVHWLEKREGRRVLRDLTDDQLSDIGLTRREAAKEINKSFFWD